MTTSVRAAAAWLDSLDSRQRAQALYDLDGGDLSNWNYTPRRRPGLALRDQSRTQQQAVFALLETVCSDDGLRKVRDVLRLEGILGELTGRPDYRDPENYALALFGQPSDQAPWAFRFEGHHVSLTFTFVPDQGVAVTPHFLGSNPAIVPSRHTHAGFELLREERERALAIVAALDPALRDSARINWTMPSDIVTGPGREQSLRSPAGLAMASMHGSAQEAVMQLIAAFAGNLRGPLAGDSMARIREHGTDGIHFGFAGEPEIGRPHYFRLHGPSVLIEYDDTRGNHVHAVWHDPTDSFGSDRLRQHYDESRHD
ncbi:MAG: DUF3500 domain-containing protein [Geminicoccaceae bacterium]